MNDSKKSKRGSGSGLKLLFFPLPPEFIQTFSGASRGLPQRHYGVSKETRPIQRPPHKCVSSRTTPSVEMGSTSPVRPRFGPVKPVTPQPGHKKAGAPDYETSNREGQPSGLRGRLVKPQAHSSSDVLVRRSRGMACYSTCTLSSAASRPPQLPLRNVASGCSTWPRSSRPCLDPGSGHVLVGGR